MKKIVFVLLAVFYSLVSAQETITVVNAQGPTQSMTSQILRVLEEANSMQTRYKFVTEFKPGGFESIGIKYMLESPTNRVVTVTPVFLEGVDRGFVKLDSLVPVFSHGDGCWAIITTVGDTKRGTDSLKNSNAQELLMGTPALLGASHLIALQLGEKYNIPVRVVVFRSTYEALVNMAGDDKGVNITFERLSNYDQFLKKNPKLQALGISCPTRDPAFPQVKTLKEQGILDSPGVFQYTLASPDMPVEKRKDIEKIFTQVYQKIGRKEMYSYADFDSPVFHGQDSASHYKNRLATMIEYRNKYRHLVKE